LKGPAGSVSGEFDEELAAGEVIGRGASHMQGTADPATYLSRIRRLCAFVDECAEARERQHVSWWSRATAVV
jgi:hypothetical protein